MADGLTKGKFTEFYWTAPDRDMVPIRGKDYRNDGYFSQDGQPRILRQVIDNELGLGTPREGNDIPKHIEYMRRHDLVQPCQVSEKGHLTWHAKGVMMQRLLRDYARNLASEWGAIEMINPILIRADHNEIGELMGEFHERDYKVDGGRGLGFLRYASDPLGFPYMQQARWSESQGPLKTYEEASCFRNEQDGEVSGLKRVRNFLMTDMHAACANKSQAFEEFGYLANRFGTLMNDVIARGRWVLAWEGTTDYFHENRNWLKQIGDTMGVPALFKLMPEMSHYYAMKNEYQSVLADGSNIQVSTVQWDVKNGPRFDIGYIGSDGQKHPSPVILHASSFGSIERTLCTILENIAADEKEGRTPEFPLWLAPTQVRVVPVNDKYLEYADRIAQKITDDNVRADVDDRSDTIGKRIRNSSAKEWIPYVVVVGEKEASGGQLQVRERASGKTRPTDVQDLVKSVRKDTRGMPTHPLPLPRFVSKRPAWK